MMSQDSKYNMTSTPSYLIEWKFLSVGPGFHRDIGWKFFRWPRIPPGYRVSDGSLSTLVRHEQILGDIVDQATLRKF